MRPVTPIRHTPVTTPPSSLRFSAVQAPVPVDTGTAYRLRFGWRRRMTFVDDISIHPSGLTAEGRLFVAPDAGYLRDHFPGAPVLPGLVMLEAAVQVASALLPPGGNGRAAHVLERVERLQVVRPVVPGETVAIVAERLKDAERAGYTARGHVDGRLVMRAQFQLQPVTPDGDRREATGP
jgi:3-hydroxyacyl-[acyl-carrier-protein] dehydratase